MKKKLLLFALLLLAWGLQQHSARAQCPVNFTYAPQVALNVCLNTTVNFTATVPTGTNFDFNSGLPTGWGSTGGATFAVEPCADAFPGNDGTPFFWASTVAVGTPSITTSALDASGGGTIAFDMAYSIQGGISPCEGPDLPDEGVHLQYSTDGGATWTDIQYWNPSPGTAGTWSFTGAWDRLTVPIPAAAQTCNTLFRWWVSTTSGTCCDNWGLDNIVVTGLGAPPHLIWDFGDGSPQVGAFPGASGSTNVNHTYTAVGSYTATLTVRCGNGTCSDVVTAPVTVIDTPPTVTITAGSLNVCPTASNLLTATIAGGAAVYQWYLDGASIPGATASTYVATTAGSYQVEVTNACGTGMSNTLALTFDDNIPPVISGCPSDITVNNDPATCGAIVTWTEPTASDNCAFGSSPVPVGYTYSTCSYSPVTPTGATTTVGLGDDQVSTAEPVGFSFDFYGTTYTDFYISSNGFIQFNGGTASGCCSGLALPNATAGYADMIALAWTDLNPTSGGTIDYFTQGTAGNQVTVIRFNGINHFGGGGTALTAQIELYEATGEIRIVYTSFADDGSNVTGGLNHDGTQADPIPGYNATNWSANNQCHSFTPITIGSFAQTQGPPSGSVFPIGTTLVEYTADDSYGNVTTCTFNVTVNLPDPLVTDITACDVGSYAITATEQSFLGAVEWYDAPAGGTLLHTGTTYNTPVLGTGTYTYYVQETASPILTTVYSQDFEVRTFSRTSDRNPMHNDYPNWEYDEAAGGGRIRVHNGWSQSGNNCLTLDQGGVNHVILTQDLSAYAASTGIELQFSLMDHGEENHPNDRIWIRGSSTDAWIEVVNLNTDFTVGLGTWETFTIDVDAVLAANAQTPTATFQVRFGQEDTTTADNTTQWDGISVDDVSITATSAASCATARVPVTVTIGAPPNDAYCNAAPAPLGLSGPYTNCGATSEDTGWSEGTASCAGGSAPTDQNNTIWMSFTCPDNGYYSVTTAGSNNLYDVGGGHDTNDAFDAVLGIYQQTGGTCANPTLSPLGCGSNPAGSVAPTGSYADSVTVSNILMTAGTTYYIQVMGQNYSPGGAGPHNSTSDDIYLNIYPNIILPIEITSFEGEAQEEINLITWRTVEEVNGSHFEVERSLDGERFSKLGQVAVKGSNSTYHFVDLEPAQEAYYRLKLVDLDGSYAYTKNIFLRRDAAQAFSLELSPNPTPDELHVSYMAEAGNEISMEVSTSEGKVLETRQVRVQKGQNKMSLNFGQYASGMYFFTLIDGNERIVRKVIKE